MTNKVTISRKVKSRDGTLKWTSW